MATLAPDPRHNGESTGGACADLFRRRQGDELRFAFLAIVAAFAVLAVGRLPRGPAIAKMADREDRGGRARPAGHRRTMSPSTPSRCARASQASPRRPGSRPHPARLRVARPRRLRGLAAQARAVCSTPCGCAGPMSRSPAAPDGRLNVQDLVDRALAPSSRTPSAEPMAFAREQHRDRGGAIVFDDALKAPYRGSRSSPWASRSCRASPPMRRSASIPT